MNSSSICMFDYSRHISVFSLRSTTFKLDICCGRSASKTCSPSSTVRLLCGSLNSSRVPGFKRTKSLARSTNSCFSVGLTSCISLMCKNCSLHGPDFRSKIRLESITNLEQNLWKWRCVRPRSSRFLTTASKVSLKSAVLQSIPTNLILWTLSDSPRWWLARFLSRNTGVNSSPYSPVTFSKIGLSFSWTNSALNLVSSPPDSIVSVTAYCRDSYSCPLTLSRNLSLVSARRASSFKRRLGT